LANEISFEELSQRSGIPLSELQEREITSTTKRPRRIAEFDWTQLDRSLKLNMPSDIALTFLDYFSISNRGKRYEELDLPSKRFIGEVESRSKVPVSILSTQFGPAGIIDRRNWTKEAL
jgi:adenylosuccinate synthase